MKADGILIDDKEQAWFYKTKLGLTEMQKQMLETTLGSSSEDYAACERESIRLFKRVALEVSHNGEITDFLLRSFPPVQVRLLRLPPRGAEGHRRDQLM